MVKELGVLAQLGIKVMDIIMFFKKGKVNFKNEEKLIEIAERKIKILKDNPEFKIEFQECFVGMKNNPNFECTTNYSEIRNYVLEVIREYNTSMCLDYAKDCYKIEHSSEDFTTENIDVSWFLTYIKITENINDDILQKLWGKILAGEVNNPESYSLRFIETLKLLSKDEAQIVNKIGALILDERGIITDEELIKSYEITDKDILLLQEIGFINSQPVFFDENPAEQWNISFSKYVMVFRIKNPIEMESKTKFKKLGCTYYHLTNVGRVLSKLLLDSCSEPSYYKKYIDFMSEKYPDYEIFFYEIISRNEEGYEYNDDEIVLL